jgi:hypothetical protein
MSELDVFAALRLGVKFDTQRFEKDIKQFEPKVVAAPAPDSEGKLAIFSNLIDATHLFIYKLAFLAFLAYKIALSVSVIF